MKKIEDFACFPIYEIIETILYGNWVFRSMENLSVPDVEPPPASPDAINFTVHLQRGEMGFGFRIIGGQEEGTQVKGPLIDQDSP